MAASLDLAFSKVVGFTAHRLLQFGFKKSGSVFRLISGDNAALIEFQKSRHNTSQKLSFTVNVAVVCGLLLDPDALTVKKCRAIDGHLRTRIGTFLPDQQGKWWEIIHTTDEDSLSIEIAYIICDMVVPYLLRYIKTSELITLWESGQAPGLTENARIKKLEMLRNMLVGRV